jgi:glycosyltransferase involved in cell wall biosynthesis
MKATPKKKMRILFLAADKYPPFRVDVSVLFGREMVSRGHTIHWLLQSEKPLDKDIETKWQGGPAWVGKTDTGPSLWSRFRMHFYNFLNDFKMFKLMAHTPYDIVIVKDKFIAGVMAVLASRVFNTKLIYWLSFPFDEDSFFRVKEKTVRYPLLYLIRGIIFRGLLYRIIMPGCEHALVQTEYMKSNMVKKGVPSWKMTAVPMAVSIHSIPFFGHERNFSTTNTDPTVVYLGTLIKIRRMDFLLRVFKMVLEHIQNAKLILVGGSEVKADEEDLRCEAVKHGISHAVSITGFLPQKDALAYVEKADVCVSPIYPSPIFDVGSPTKLLEYMAMGKAAVANDQPEQRMVIAESQAGICVPYNEEAFCQAIVHIIRNQDEAHQMGLKGRKYIEENRNYTQTADIVEQKLLNIVGEYTTSE